MGDVIKTADPYFRRMRKFNKETELRRKTEIFLLELSPLARTSDSEIIRHRVGLIILQFLLLGEQRLG